ncbi:DUF2059 domain-containing protein [Epibacterium sp. SM1979]|uniref:DUF2059 domain-containing protein n=1 Tax=Tritonibacter litoralis TaxID=2662264 RepID=A0A843Y8D6_9RHOB|nr:DUF2059 domain-containing protein [Tritonibacter litoralis]MQQ07136.1 DUF2059 domain-containing protein [Tritonibacter litoralis]
MITKTPLPRPLFFVAFFVAGFLALTLATATAQAADRARIETFLNVTGFDVALDSIALSAESAPGMIGLTPEDFGGAWDGIADTVFSLPDMRNQALDYLEETLSDAALTHAEAFYATELGQRLVKAENASHLVEDSDTKHIAGRRIVADLVQAGDNRVDILKRMGRAVDAGESSVKAVQEVQFRFIVAAETAGIIELQLEPDALKGLLAEQEDEMRLEMVESALTSSAYAYQGFTNQELETYSDALETPEMQEVYRLLNAIQFEITASRYEELAYRLGKIGPSEDI